MEMNRIFNVEYTYHYAMDYRTNYKKVSVENMKNLVSGWLLISACVDDVYSLIGVYDNMEKAMNEAISTNNYNAGLSPEKRFKGFWLAIPAQIAKLHFRGF